MQIGRRGPLIDRVLCRSERLRPIHASLLGTEPTVPMATPSASAVAAKASASAAAAAAAAAAATAATLVSSGSEEAAATAAHTSSHHDGLYPSDHDGIFMEFEIVFA